MPEVTIHFEDGDGEVRMTTDFQPDLPGDPADVTDAQYYALSALAHLAQMFVGAEVEEDSEGDAADTVAPEV